MTGYCCDTSSRRMYEGLAGVASSNALDSAIKSAAAAAVIVDLVVIISGLSCIVVVVFG